MSDAASFLIRGSRVSAHHQNKTKDISKKNTVFKYQISNWHNGQNNFSHVLIPALISGIKIIYSLLSWPVLNLDSPDA